MKNLPRFTLLSVGSLLTAFLYPYGEVLGTLLSLLTFLWAIAVTGFGWYAFNKDYKLHRVARWSILIAAAPAVMAYFTCISRRTFDVYIPMPIDGVVVKVYSSKSHNSPAVDVRDASFHTLSIEPVPESTWAQLRVGERIVKAPFSTSIERGDDRLPIVDDSRFHSLRGAVP